MDKNHGGQREGAGRKPHHKGGKAIRKTIYLPQSIWDGLIREADEESTSVSRVLAKRIYKA